MSHNTMPNVFMVVADDQRFDTIQALGNDYIETPHLDSLVEEGCTFTHHHNMGADIGAVCVPARSMIHSGQSLFHLEGPGGMTTAHATLPEAFNNAGYRTFGTGKWHNGTEAFNRCFVEGENVFFGGMCSHWNVPVCSRYPMGEYPDPKPGRFDSGTGSIQPSQQVYDRFSSGKHSSELFAGTAIEFLADYEESEADRPFFAYMATTAPHDPRTAPGEYLAQYDSKKLLLPKNFYPEHPFDNGHFQIRDEELETRPRNPENIRRHIADYYAMITHLDAQIGRILRTLEEIGEKENTIFVFTADHGLAVGQHGLLGKQNLYDHSVRVPLLMSGPGIPENASREALSCHYDIYPTLCDLAGIDVPRMIDGESLVPMLEDPDATPRESVMLAYEDTQRAIRDERYKLIEYYVDGCRHTHLFDIASDPAETKDLSNDEHHTDDVERLRIRLAESQREMDDPMIRT